MKYALLLLSLTFLGCASAPTVKSWLDPVSSATITAQMEPLILARDDQTLPMNERQFAQLAAVEVNRMGDRKLYLVAILWSNADRGRAEREIFEDAFARVEMRMGDRSVSLERHAGEIGELGVGQSPLPLPIPGSQQIYFPIERADLNALARSNRVQLIAQGRPESPQRYEEWQDGRRSLSDFLGQLPGNESLSLDQ
ncbi:MAG: hypothetical protein ABW171_02545 [Steroidobacter sp.]